MPASPPLHPNKLRLLGNILIRGIRDDASFFYAPTQWGPERSTAPRDVPHHDLSILLKDFQSLCEHINHRIDFRLGQHCRQRSRTGVNHHETSFVKKVNEEFNLPIFRRIRIRLPVSRWWFRFQVNAKHRTGARHACVCSHGFCLLYTSPSPRDRQKSRMPSSA